MQVPCSFLIIFFMLSCMYSLYILDIKLLPDIHLQISSYFIGGLFLLLIVLL